MQIEVYRMDAEADNLTITLEAVCDSFSSLLWDIEYYQCGSFEVYIAANLENLSIFRTGRIVGRDDWFDYSEDSNVCGYCKCILGKCKVTDLMAQMAQLIAEVQENNETIAELTNKVEQLETEVEDIGDIVYAGQCGENAYYALYSSGKVLVKGTGAMYDYDLESNRSPFYRNDAVRSVVVSEGITTVGEDAFERCLNLESVSLPTSLTSIGSGAFMPADEYPSFRLCGR